MTSADVWKILIAAIGFGAGGEAVRQYRGFKARRRAAPYEQRNAGFWTDKRVYLAEAVFCAAAMAIPFTAIVLFMSIGRPIWVGYVGLLGYAASVFILMRSLNLREPQ